MLARGTLNTAKGYTKQSTLGDWELRSRKAAQIDKPSWPSLPKGNRKEKIPQRAALLWFYTLTRWDQGDVRTWPRQPLRSFLSNPPIP